MDETGADSTEWSKPERKTPIQYTNTYIRNLERWQWRPCMQDRKKDTPFFQMMISFISFSCLIALTRTFSTKLNTDSENGTFVLFLITQEKLSTFHPWVWCWLWVCRIWPLLCWGTFLCNQFLNNFLKSQTDVEFCQMPFLLYYQMIFFFYSVMMDHIGKFAYMLKHHCIPATNPTW